MMLCIMLGTRPSNVLRNNTDDDDDDTDWSNCVKDNDTSTAVKKA